MFKRFFNKKAALIEETDPDRIYVENVRSFFNISTKWAKYICKLAVRQGIFRKKFAVTCKNENCERIIGVFNSEEDIPDKIDCLHCEIDGKYDYSFSSNELEIVEYYQYLENDDAKES